MITGKSRSVRRTFTIVGALLLAAAGASLAASQRADAQTATVPTLSPGQGVEAPGGGPVGASPAGTASGGNVPGAVTPGIVGGMAPTPDVTPGVAAAGSSKVPVTGSVPNAATADYPTDATADYVFACMASNGNSRIALEQCSCSFDVVATLLPYERYVEASTFLSMGQVAGEKGVLFRSSEQAKATVADLRRAQAEAEVRCFD